jgi:predicted ribonuclease YlaK
MDGRVQLSATDLSKTWCFADANVFLHHIPFDEVNWPKQIGVDAAVIVVPTSVLRALDHYKADFEHVKRQRRARQVLPKLAQYALNVTAGSLAPVRSGVELLLRDREPLIPDGLDPRDQDDRIIADALDFKWSRPGANVVMLSGDYTVRLKARSWGLGQMAVPEGLELPSLKPPHEVTGDAGVEVS